MADEEKQKEEERIEQLKNKIQREINFDFKTLATDQGRKLLDDHGLFMSGKVVDSKKQLIIFDREANVMKVIEDQTVAQEVKKSVLEIQQDHIQKCLMEDPKSLAQQVLIKEK